MTTLRIGHTPSQASVIQLKSSGKQSEAQSVVRPTQVIDHRFVDWDQFHYERAQVITEQRTHPGLILYRDLALGDLRQQLQDMVGVDLYV